MGWALARPLLGGVIRKRPFRRGLPLVVFLQHASVGGHLASRPVEFSLVAIDIAGAFRLPQQRDSHALVLKFWGES